MNALIIEDDANIVEAVILCLQLRWPQISTAVAVEGIEGVEKSKSKSFDIAILDINLPDIDGFEVLKRIRSFSNMPIIILTVRGSEDDQARGLETGADDYLVKPFRPRDLIARVSAVLRRSQTPTVTTENLTLTRGQLTLDISSNTVDTGEDTVKLTPIETKLLHALMKNAGITLGADELLGEVWGEQPKSPQALRTHIRRLRDKIKDKPPGIILNQHGGGYRFTGKE